MDSTWEAPPNDLPFRRGDAIDRFTVLEPLGAGGMGVVVSAYDGTLDRKVAIKVLRPDRLTLDPAEGRNRLLREAQAMARLKHPNVITVYEFGTIGEQVFVAMELVEGETLAAWLRRTPHSWQEVVRMFVSAGEGLAAAHRAGLVHRDFKPDNVLVSSDGDVRVTDFGLASVAAGSPGSETGAALSSPLTRTGAVMGTPAYMSPEQHRGEEADARSDQFSFCVSLYQALYGIRPFAGNTPEKVLEAIEARQLTAPLRAAPRRLRPLVVRGLEPRPEDRWPTLDTLLAALARDPAAARRKWLAAGAASVVLAGVGGTLFSVSRDPCPVPEAQVAAVWGEARAAAVRARLAALDPDQGGARFAAAERTIEPFVREWRDMHVEACQATRVRGAQSDSLLDLRMRCLNRRLAELDGGTKLLTSAANREELDGALSGLHQLSPVAGCSDETALARELAAPATPDGRARADALAERTQKLEIEVRADRLVGLSERAEALIAEARRLDHAPTLAAALVALARIRLKLMDSVAAEAALRELIAIAARAHEDRVEAFAWIQLVRVVGSNRKRPDLALPMVPAANAAVVRAGDPVDLRADLLQAQAVVPEDAARATWGLEHLQQARRLLEAAGAEQPGSPLAQRLASVLHEIGGAYFELADQDAALASYRQAIERWRALYGGESLDEAKALHDIGLSLRRAGRLDEALVAAHEAARINETRTGHSARWALNNMLIGSVLTRQGHFESALESYDRALAAQRTLSGASSVELSAGLLNRANVLGRLGRVAEASRGYGELIALLESAHSTTANLPSAYYNRGELAREHDRCADAVRDYRRSRELLEQQRGPKHHYLIYPLVGEGRCLVMIGRSGQAIPIFDRVLALDTDAEDALGKTLARAWRACALIASGRDPAGGRAQLREPRAELAELARTDDELGVQAAQGLRELDRWLAGQRR